MLVAGSDRSVTLLRNGEGNAGNYGKIFIRDKVTKHRETDESKSPKVEYFPCIEVFDKEKSTTCFTCN